LFLSFIKFLKSLLIEIPTIGGWYHLLWIGITLFLILLFVYLKKRKIVVNENLVFGIYGFSSLIFEILKQIMWSVTFNTNGTTTWRYQWYAFPYQFCTTPMYVAILLVFIKNKKVRQYLYSYLAFYTIISAIAVMAYPTTVFVEDLIVDIHTMILHCGSLVISCFVIINKLCDFTIKTYFKGTIVFIIAVIIALILNFVVVKTNINHGELFNMFYISPYFESLLPVFNQLWYDLPYILFLLCYCFTFMLTAFILNRLYHFVDKHFN